MVEKTDEGQQTEKKDSDADALSSLICAGLGGKDNIISLDCCATRLHVAMKDPMQMDDILLQASGAADDIWLSLMHLFSRSCHQKAERSFFIHGYQCPVCARCSGLYLGYGFGILLWMFSVTLPLAVYGLFMLSMLIDWGLQAADVLPSTNVRRFVSGVLCGIAVIGIFHALLQAIF